MTYLKTAQLSIYLWCIALSTVYVADTITIPFYRKLFTPDPEMEIVEHQPQRTYTAVRDGQGQLIIEITNADTISSTDTQWLYPSDCRVRIVGTTGTQQTKIKSYISYDRR